jgi:hypothetical protein
MKVSVGTTEFMRWAGATLGITSLATATSVVLLYAVGTEFAWAIFAGLYVWLAVSILMWLGAPRYLGPAVRRPSAHSPWRTLDLVASLRGDVLIRAGATEQDAVRCAEMHRIIEKLCARIHNAATSPKCRRWQRRAGEASMRHKGSDKGSAGVHGQRRDPI